MQLTTYYCLPLLPLLLAPLAAVNGAAVAAVVPKQSSCWTGEIHSACNGFATGCTPDGIMVSIFLVSSFCFIIPFPLLRLLAKMYTAPCAQNLFNPISLFALPSSRRRVDYIACSWAELSAEKISTAFSLSYPTFPPFTNPTNQRKKKYIMSGGITNGK
jgi:hypothetical protein